jgi:hypothetical protein
MKALREIYKIHFAIKSNWQSFRESLQMQVKIMNGKRPF